jgi:hypothetical protein
MPVRMGVWQLSERALRRTAGVVRGGEGGDVSCTTGIMMRRQGNEWGSLILQQGKRHRVGLGNRS